MACKTKKSLLKRNKKRQLVERLAQAGFSRIERASFVHPKVVPQMSDAPEMAKFSRELGLTFLALTLSQKALTRAIEVGVPQIAVFVGASETFNEKNINRSIADSLAECVEVFKQARQYDVFIRGYVSMCFSFPYEGAISYEQVKRVVSHFTEHGVNEISIGDTNGEANPKIVFERFSQLKADFPEMTFVAHFHDTNGFAYANIIAALQAGVTKFDSSVAGLGGCPLSPGATGNVATEKGVLKRELMK